MGKRVLITGANTGLGFETAKVLLREGHEVIMGNRSPERSQRALEELSRLGYPGRVESLPLDLEDRGSIQDFAEAFKERYGSLDVLVNNAGVSQVMPFAFVRVVIFSSICSRSSETPSTSSP